MSQQETEYYCLNCGKKLDQGKIESHMDTHRKEQVRVQGKITRQLQKR